MDAILDDVTIHRRRQTLYKMTNDFGLEDAYSTALDRIREQRGNRVRLGIRRVNRTRGANGACGNETQPDNRTPRPGNRVDHRV